MRRTSPARIIPIRAGLPKPALWLLPVDVDVVDVAAAAGGEQRDHLRALEVGQAAAQGRRHVGRDQRLADVVEMDGVVDVGGNGLLVGRLEVDAPARRGRSCLRA